MAWNLVRSVRSWGRPLVKNDLAVAASLQRFVSTTPTLRFGPSAVIQMAHMVSFFYPLWELEAQTKPLVVLISHGYLWSHVEPNCSIIAACLPTYGPLFADGGMASFFRSIRSLFSLGSAASSNDKLPSDDSKNLLSGGQINGNHEMTTPKKAWQRLDGSNVGVYAGDHRGNGGYIGKIGQSDLEAQLVAPNKITVTQVFGSEYERAQDA